MNLKFFPLKKHEKELEQTAEQMEIRTIGVVGAGLMGAGIAQAASASGFSVIMRDISDDFLKRGFSAIEQSLTRLMKKVSRTT